MAHNIILDHYNELFSLIRTAYIKVRGPGIDKVCSGTMIDRQWVLTAGHCTQYCVGYPECSREISQSEITYKVIMGEYDQSYEEVRSVKLQDFQMF